MEKTYSLLSFPAEKYPGLFSLSEKSILVFFPCQKKYPALPLPLKKVSRSSLPAKKEPAQRDTGEACPFMRAAGRSRLFQIGGYDLMFTNMYD